MIKRLYVNNFRSLVSFEVSFDSFGILCGPNGSGKSSVFDCIRLIRDLSSSELTVEDALHLADRTKWLDSNIVEFEIELLVEAKTYKYVLHIEQMKDGDKSRIVLEQAICDGKTLFERDIKGVKFEKRGGSQTGFPLDWRQAALGSIQPANDRQEIQQLQRALGDVLILRPNPILMESESKEERSRPDIYLRHLTSWYRHLNQEQEWTNHLRDSLQSVWPDFRSFRLVNTGLQSKALQLRFDHPGDPELGTLYLSQLSDGEKMLVGLYMVQSAFATGAARTILLDEPDNFVGLPELQPWLTSIMELSGDEAQAILITHHPELLDVAGQAYGRYLWREGHTSPTRIGPLRAVEGISLSETVARGWVSV